MSSVETQTVAGTEGRKWNGMRLPPAEVCPVLPTRQSAFLPQEKILPWLGGGSAALQIPLETVEPSRWEMHNWFSGLGRVDG